MVRLLLCCLAIRLSGFVYLLNHDVAQEYAQKPIIITARVRAGNVHRYELEWLSVDDKPLLLYQEVVLFTNQDLSMGATYLLRIQIKSPDLKSKSLSWYQHMWYQTHHQVKLIDVMSCVASPKPSWRTKFLTYLDAHIPNNQFKPLLASLMWGDRHLISTDVYQAFIQTGTAHILAISGLHVTWLIGMVMALGGSVMLALSVGWGYVLFALAPPSAIRAMLMATISLTLPEIGWVYVLILTLVVHLTLLPMDVFSLATFLSYWAIIMIRFITVFGKGGLIEFSVLLSLLMMPVSLSFFHQWPIASVWLNIFVVPWFSFIVLPLMIIALLLSLFGMPGIWPMVYCCLKLVVVTLKAFEDWPKLYLFDHMVLSVVILQITVMYLIIKRPKVHYCLAAMIVPYLVLHHPIKVPYGAFSMVMLDVGQGLSVWIKTHKHAVLYDAGPKYAGQKVVMPFLASQGLGQLSHIIISHWDQDHVGGLDAIRPKTKAKIITSNPSLGEPCLYGQSFDLDGVSFKFYHPTQKRHKSKNKDSCVLLVSNHQKKAILLGDIDQNDEKQLVKRLWGQAVNVMVAAHHGSKGSNGYPLLYTLHPEMIWVSAGRNNPYHHPHIEAMQRFFSITDTVKVTARDGMQRYDAKV